MLHEDNDILKYKHGEDFMKAPFIIYADIVTFLEKISACHNNLNESSTIKINNHMPSGYSIFTHYSFDNTKNRLNHHRGQDSMKIICKALKEHAEKMIK